MLNRQSKLQMEQHVARGHVCPLEVQGVLGLLSVPMLGDASRPNCMVK